MFGFLKSYATASCVSLLTLLTPGLISVAAGQAQAGSQDIPRVDAQGGGAILNQWRAVGPFEGGTELELLDRNLAGNGSDNSREARQKGSNLNVCGK